MDANEIEFPITLQQGATFNFPLYIYDLVNEEEIPTVIAGWTAHMQARQTPNDPITLFDLSTVNGGITIITSPDGIQPSQINASIPVATTAGFTAPWKGRYDMKIFLPSGEIDRIIQGSIIVSPEVTQ